MEFPTNMGRNTGEPEPRGHAITRPSATRRLSQRVPTDREETTTASSALPTLPAQPPTVTQSSTTQPPPTGLDGTPAETLGIGPELPASRPASLTLGARQARVATLPETENTAPSENFANSGFASATEPMRGPSPARCNQSAQSEVRPIFSTTRVYHSSRRQQDNRSERTNRYGGPQNSYGSNRGTERYNSVRGDRRQETRVLHRPRPNATDQEPKAADQPKALT